MRTIDGMTSVVGVIGNPVEHSLSPLMHNHAFALTDMNWVYVPFLVNDIEDAAAGIRALSLRGASITIPFKKAIVPFLDAIDPAAKAIGSVNTVVNANGKLCGYNSDGYGALRALSEETSIAGKKVMVLGNGGSALGITAALFSEAPAHVSVVGRDAGRVNAFIRCMNPYPVLGMTFGDSSLHDRCTEADIIINTTSVGMYPEIHATPLPPDYILPKHIIFDIVYTPRETNLIRDARRQGARVVYGYKMLLHQAAVQFELWTGGKFPVADVDNILSAELERRAHV